MIRRSLDEIRQRAVHELCTNKTISTYVMLDDYEWRTPPPYVKLRLAVDYCVDSVAFLALGVENFSRHLDLIMIGGQA